MPKGAIKRANSNRLIPFSDHATPLSRTPIVLPGEDLDHMFNPAFNRRLKSVSAMPTEYVRWIENDIQALISFLDEGKTSPLDGLESILAASGSHLNHLPISAVREFGLRGAKLTQGIIKTHVHFLKLHNHPSALQPKSSEQRAGKILNNVQIAALNYPPELIFFAYCPSLNFPAENIPFLEALTKSRNTAIIDAAESLTKYLSLLSTAKSLAGDFGFTPDSLSDDNYRAIPLIRLAFENHYDADGRYLDAIISNMHDFGYLEESQ